MPNDSPLGVAGICLADGQLVWVNGAPEELEIGMDVVFSSAAGEQSGSVHIPPRLVVWRDPEVTCAAFVSASPRQSFRPTGEHWAAIQSLAAPNVPQDGPDSDLMLEVAWREIERYDGQS
jgi:hypothetical protein